jgi:hypothetical protein
MILIGVAVIAAVVAIVGFTAHYEHLKNAAAELAELQPKIAALEHNLGCEIREATASCRYAAAPAGAPSAKSIAFTTASTSSSASTAASGWVSSTTRAGTAFAAMSQGLGRPGFLHRPRPSWLGSPAIHRQLGGLIGSPVAGGRLSRHPRAAAAAA